MVLRGPNLLITVGSTGSVNKGLVINTRIIILLIKVILAGVRAFRRVGDQYRGYSTTYGGNYNRCKGFSGGLVTNTGVTVLLTGAIMAGARAF